MSLRSRQWREKQSIRKGSPRPACGVTRDDIEKIAQLKHKLQFFYND